MLSDIGSSKPMLPKLFRIQALYDIKLSDVFSNFLKPQLF